MPVGHQHGAGATSKATHGHDPDFDPANAPPGFVALSWRVEVRIEAFAGRPLPADAIEMSGT